MVNKTYIHYETPEDLLEEVTDGGNLKKIFYAIEYEKDRFGYSDFSKTLYRTVLDITHDYLEAIDGEYTLGFSPLDCVEMYTAVQENVAPIFEHPEDLF